MSVRLSTKRKPASSSRGAALIATRVRAASSADANADADGDGDGGGGGDAVGDEIESGSGVASVVPSAAVLTEQWTSAHQRLVQSLFACGILFASDALRQMNAELESGTTETALYDALNQSLALCHFNVVRHRCEHPPFLNAIQWVLTPMSLSDNVDKGADGDGDGDGEGGAAIAVNIDSKYSALHDRILIRELVRDIVSKGVGGIRSYQQVISSFRQRVQPPISESDPLKGAFGGKIDLMERLKELIEELNNCAWLVISSDHRISLSDRAAVELKTFLQAENLQIICALCKQPTHYAATCKTLCAAQSHSHSQSPSATSASASASASSSSSVEDERKIDSENAMSVEGASGAQGEQAHRSESSDVGNFGCSSCFHLYCLSKDGGKTMKMSSCVHCKTSWSREKMSALFKAR